MLRIVLRSRTMWLRPHVHRRVFSSDATPVSRKLRAAAQTPKATKPFEVAVQEFFEAVVKAMDVMKTKNHPFTISIMSDAMQKEQQQLMIDLGPAKGLYMLQPDHEEQLLGLQSPVSGTFRYRYDQESAHWLSVEDNHDIRGLITRDLIRHCVGYPDFK